MHETNKTLCQIAAERPFPDYQVWWPLGASFIRHMASAIVPEWRLLQRDEGDLADVTRYSAEYLHVVYGRKSPAALVEQFVSSADAPLQSGEFDALSYAFFRSAFESLAGPVNGDSRPLQELRRAFTKRVGKRFYAAVHEQLHLEPPAVLDSAGHLLELKACIHAVGGFLLSEGYVRDHFAFHFTVDQPGRSILQAESTFLDRLNRNGVGYALYEMGYPVILPSAVYLYNTIGEAQHHSSRTIEELFARAGCDACETDDFDPGSFNSDHVVELWEVRKNNVSGNLGAAQN